MHDHACATVAFETLILAADAFGTIRMRPLAQPLVEMFPVHHSHVAVAIDGHIVRCGPKAQ